MPHREPVTIAYTDDHNITENYTLEDAGKVSFTRRAYAPDYLGTIIIEDVARTTRPMVHWEVLYEVEEANLSFSIGLDAELQICKDEGGEVECRSIPGDVCYLMRTDDGRVQVYIEA